eukprot:GFUD01002945.1.p1 GENE.GFUD01002945.1~~GFUD01002945.1.p1  ORF type:complete len:385 (+),score=72.52 GFUD01002945.1:393-1547(+)
MIKTLNMDKQFWLKHSRRAVVIFLTVKLIMGLQNIIFPKPMIEPVTVSHKLETLYDADTDTFSVLDRTNVSFLMRPHTACRNVKIVLMALTAPKNVEKRERLRRQFGEKEGVYILFLLGKTSSSSVQEDLQAENMLHGDMVQISVMDHYRALSYKTLTGFIWANRFCGSAKFIVKVDDDVTLDLDNLLFLLEKKYGENSPHGGTVPDIVECPSVMRNMRPWRQNHTESIMSKWSISKEDMERRVYPDFCPGWLYVMTPRVGLALAEVGVKHAQELMSKARLDDIFVTGFLRERLPWATLQQLHDGPMGQAWNGFFSHCPFMGITKNIFYNDVVLDKGSNGVSYIKGQKFYWCAFLEFFILENLEFVFPSLATHTAPLWAVCRRS